MDFNDVIGQQDAKNRLSQMIEEQRIPHALMLCGPKGCGKMAMAMALSATLLRQGHENSANTEAMLKTWEHPDLHFTYPVIKPTGTSSDHKMTSDDFSREWHDMIVKSSYFSIEHWLEEMKAENQQAIIFEAESDLITHNLSLKSSQGGWKICLIWLPERMNITCANKILKILEEPPQQTVFIMVCEEPEKLLDTIRSRVQRIDLKRIADSDIEEALVNRRLIDADTAKRIARIANGSWLRALEQMEANSENAEMLEWFKNLMRLAYMRNVKGMKAWSETIAATGREKQLRAITYFSRMIRENFMYNFQLPQLNYMSQEEEAFAKNFAKFVNEANVIEISELFQKARREIAQNGNAKIIFFDVSLQMIVLLIRKQKT